MVFRRFLTISRKSNTLAIVQKSFSQKVLNTEDQKRGHIGPCSRVIESQKDVTKGCERCTGDVIPTGD